MIIIHPDTLLAVARQGRLAAQQRGLRSRPQTSTGRRLWSVALAPRAIGAGAGAASGFGRAGTIREAGDAA